MTDNRTFKLIEGLLGEPVMGYFARHRADERSWDWIARDLQKRVGVGYSREWLRRCYLEASTAERGETPASAA